MLVRQLAHSGYGRRIGILVHFVEDQVIVTPSPFLVALAALLLAATAPAESLSEPPPVSANFVLRAWDTADGLPDNNVSGMTQTPDGYMWLATRAGLARFDGVRITVFRKGDLPGLESDNIRTVHAARDGALWLGLERGGVARLVEGRCTVIAPMLPKTATTRWVSSFAEDREGAVWFGFAPDIRVERWRAGKLTSFGLEEGLPGGADYFVHADLEGRIWVANRFRVALFDGAKFQQLHSGDGPSVHLACAREGGVWVTRGDHLMRYWADGRSKEVADLTPLGGAREITSVFETRDGDLWLGTSGMGLCRFRGGRFQRVATSHSYILALGEDRAGKLWVGTQGGGVDLLRPRRFVLRDKRHGLLKDSIASLCTDAAGTLWIAPRWSAPARATDGTNKNFEPLENWYARNVTTLCADRDGGVWIGHDGGQFARWFQGTLTRPEVPEADRVETLYVDSAGILWVATIDGPLIRWHENHADLEPISAGLVRVRALGEDAAGRLWAGTEEGLLFRRENGRFVPEVVPGAKPGQSIRFIVPDGSDTLWIGTREGGILRWRSGTFVRWSVDRGLPHDDVRALMIDDARDLWLGTLRGLFRVNRRQIEAVLEGKQRATRAVFFGASEGVPNTSFVEAGRNTTARTRDGRLWFATDRGALEVQAARDEHDTPPAPVMIEEIRADGAVVPLARGDVPPSTRRVEVRFTAPYFGTPERVQFRYRLSGLDETWVDTGGQRSATFARLPPGRYRFEVAATDGEGEWQRQTASLPFAVRAAWWETPWFKIAALSAAAGCLAWAVRAIVKRRLRARIQRLEQEHALERERIRIARDMHDQLGASLTQISIASQLAKLDASGAAGHVEEIATIARSTVDSLDEIVWAVNPRHDTLASLAEYLGKYTVSFLTGSGITARVDIPQDLPLKPLSSNVRHHLFLAVREALNNTVKHAGASTVWLQMKLSDGLLRVTLSDDGRGFSSAEVEADANGLRNIRERMAEVHGECRIDGSTARGTRVICELPLAGNGA